MKSCPLCKSVNVKRFCVKKDSMFKINKEYILLECLRCKLIFVDPVPSCKELEKHYPKDYYSYKKIRTKEKCKNVKLKIILYKIFFSKKGSFFKKILFYPLKHRLRRVPIIEGIKLLDVGCGSGQFIYEMKECGLDVLGVEPGKINSKDSKEKGVTIINSELIPAKFLENQFDIVTINHVLEHVHNQHEIISEIKRILKPGGLLVVGVPNTNSISFKIQKEEWYPLDIPRHLWNFSEKNLIYFLEKNNFRKKWSRHISRGDYFFNSPHLKIRTKRLWILPSFKKAFSLIQNTLRLSDQIEVGVVNNEV